MKTICRIITKNNNIRVIACNYMFSALPYIEDTAEWRIYLYDQINAAASESMAFTKM